MLNLANYFPLEAESVLTNKLWNDSVHVEPVTLIPAFLIIMITFS